MHSLSSSQYQRNASAKPTVARGENCINQYAVLVSASGINVMSDLMILVIPIVAIWGLHMSREKRIKLSTVFPVGLLYDYLNPKSLMTCLDLEDDATAVTVMLTWYDVAEVS